MKLLGICFRARRTGDGQNGDRRRGVRGSAERYRRRQSLGWFSPGESGRQAGKNGEQSWENSTEWTH